MAVSVIVYEFDALQQRMNEMQESLKRLAAILDENTNVQRFNQLPTYRYVTVYKQVTVKPKRPPALLFPLNLLALGIEAMFKLLEQAVHRFVVRVIGRRFLNRFLRPKEAPVRF